jgi:protein-S-isoprenylcysteine O-methyltransferase Ste14
MTADDTFRIVLLAGMLIVLPVAVWHRLRAHTGETLERRQEGLFILLTLRPLGLAMIAGLIAYIVSPRAMAWSSLALPVWMRWTGVALGTIAGALLIWTLRSLGPNLTDTVVTRKQHTLVTHGPYRFVRHPFYASVALAMLANALVAANWFLLAIGALVLALLVIRTAKEEDNLLARFGEEYADYMRHTGRFVPRLSRAAGGYSSR